MNPCRFFLLLAATVATAPLAAQTTDSTNVPPPGSASVATGFDYSRGSYGFPTDTEVLLFPLDLAWDNGSWTLRANLSYLNIKGPATIVAGGGTARPTASSQSGVGDIYLGATYRLGPVVGPANLDATARVKLPTASEGRGLGTGEADEYVQLDAYCTHGAVTPFGTVGYRILGDNATYQLRDGLYVAGGAHFRASPATVVTASLGWGQRLVAGGDHTSDATVALTHDVDLRWRVMGYLLKGFSDASPDFGAGARITYRF
jgi:hypothetical protein